MGAVRGVEPFQCFILTFFLGGIGPPQRFALGGGQHFEARIDRGNSTFFENGINRANLRFLTYIVYIDTLMSKCDRSVLKTFVV